MSARINHWLYENYLAFNNGNVSICLSKTIYIKNVHLPKPLVVLRLVGFHEESFTLVLLTSWLQSLHYKQGHTVEGQSHCNQYNIMIATNVPKAKTSMSVGVNSPGTSKRLKRNKQKPYPEIWFAKFYKEKHREGILFYREYKFKCSGKYPGTY